MIATANDSYAIHIPKLSFLRGAAQPQAPPWFGRKIISALRAENFLVLCSGCGAVGLEAESRGASMVVCVDRQVKFLKYNKESLGAGIDIVRQDITRYLNITDLTFDSIFLDPILPKASKKQSKKHKIICLIWFER